MTMHVLFINENALGHGSYLRPFVETLRNSPEYGIVPHQLDANPLPPALDWRANASVPGLRRWGLDFSIARWRRIVSTYVRGQVEELSHSSPFAAIVVNTQSVGLSLVDLIPEIPVLVCLDATFQQLASSPWFAPNEGSRRLLPLTLSPVSRRERELLRRATHLFPWSDPVRQSLLRDYGCHQDRITRLPPSVPAVHEERARRVSGKAQILFIGGDFHRKGGPMLLRSFRERLSDRWELHLVTQSDIRPEPGVFVHQGVEAHSPEWRQRWLEADVFVFPSALETFGIVLVEALAFGVPVVATEVGAAREILEDGRAGTLLSNGDERSLADAVDSVLDDPDAARIRTEAGRQWVRTRYDLRDNTRTLAAVLHAVRNGGV